MKNLLRLVVIALVLGGTSASAFAAQGGGAPHPNEPGQSGN